MNEEQVKLLIQEAIQSHEHDGIGGKQINYFDSQYESLRGSEGLIIVTNWDDFKSPDYKRMKSLLKIPVIFDGRNIYDKSILNKAGFDYFGIGV